MQVNINVRFCNKLNSTELCPYSAFVKFDYDSKILATIRQLPTRYYDPIEREWEIPLTSMPKLIDRLNEYDVKVSAPNVKMNEKEDIPLPENFTPKTAPYQHQTEGVLYGLKNPRYLLGDSQGLGKTKQVIDLAVCRKLRGEIKHCLIICGINGTKYNWKKEVEIHSNEKAYILGTRINKEGKEFEGSSEDKLKDLNKNTEAFFWITNIETLRAMSSKKKKGSGYEYTFPLADKIQKLCEEGVIGMVAVDEIHKCKNPDSQIGKALLRIQPKYNVAMSGTFVLNSPMDLYLPLKWCGFESHNFYQFKNHYGVFGGFHNGELVGYKNLDELVDIMDRVMLRRLKDDVLDLPPKVYTTEYVELHSYPKVLYDEVKNRILQEVDKIRLSPDPLSQMLRLRQITGHPSTVSTAEQANKSAKMDRLCEIVKEVTDEGEKCIVYSQWTTMTNILREKLKEYNPAYITGETNTEERMVEVDNFQNDPECKVIIGTVGAMGTGLTLTAANTVIFLDEPWNRSLKEQAEDRAHRIGTKGTVRIITLVTKNTIDEAINELVIKKGEMADLLVDGKSSTKNDLFNYLVNRI